MRAASATDSEIGCFVAVYQNLGKSKSQTKFKKFIARFCVRPSVFVTMRYDKSALFGGSSELAVVVSVAATAILNSVYVIEIVNHFVKKCCDYVLYGARERSGSDVYFVRSTEF